MTKINWNSYTSTQFQHFCNALLQFEFGRNFTGFGAPGKDGGIDGLYAGPYNDSITNIRFQYKFHTTDRKTAYQSLKTELKTEVNKITDEQILILLTNVDLLPQERKELLKLIQGYLNKINQRVTFEIWDATEITRTYLKYPILQLWLEEGFTNASLLPYKTVFGSRMACLSSDLNNLTSYFSSRQNEMKQLDSFLSNDKNKLTLIIGEAGIGKTRLCIEFFKKHVDINKDWTALAISAYNLDLEKIKFSIQGSQNYIILVDDAQNYPPTTLADISRLANHNKINKVKIIFTLRSIQSYESLRLIKDFNEQNRITITLKKLSREETIEILHKELPDGYPREYISQLASISRGRPILIIGLLNAISANKNISLIKTQTSFNDYVSSYFDSFLDDVVNNTGVEKLKAKNLLRLICLIEPFEYDAIAIIEQIAQLENLTEDFIMFFLDKLKKEEFSTGNYKQSLKPDYYSDIILTNNKNKIWIKNKLDKYNNFRHNIISNLASIDEIEQDNPTAYSFFDELLKDYIDGLRSTVSFEEFNTFLQNIVSIAYQKPEIAVEAVEIFVNSVQTNSHPLYNQFNNHNYSSYQSDRTIISIREIFNDLLFHKQFREFVFFRTLDIYGIIGVSLFTGNFDYSHPLYIHYNSIDLPSFFVKKVEILLPNASDKVIEFAILGLTELLKLQFQLTQWADTGRTSLRLVRHYLPNNTIIRKHRINVIQLLIGIYTSSKNEKLKLDSFKLLIDIPREIASSKTQTYKYSSDEEIKCILEFLKTIASNIEIQYRSNLGAELYWYRKQRIPKKFFHLLDDIEALLAPQNLAQKLILLFCDLETEFHDYEIQIKSKSANLIEQHNAIQIGEAIMEIYQPDSELPHSFGEFLSILNNNYLQKSLEVYSYIKTINKEFIYLFGSSFLRPLRHDIKFIDAFWSEANDLLIEKTSKAYNVILHIYSSYWIKKSLLSDRDTDLIKLILGQNIKETHSNFPNSLITLLEVNQAEGSKLLNNFLTYCTQKEAENVFRLLSDSNINYELIRNLVLNQSQRFEISSHMEIILSNILKKEGVKEILDYLASRISYKQAIRTDGSEYVYYQIVPHGANRRITKDCCEEEKNKYFLAALTWYIESEKPISYFDDNIKVLEYLIPSSNISSKLIEIYDELFSTTNQEKEKLVQLLKSIAIFHSKDLELIKIVSVIIEHINVLFSPDQSLSSQVKSLAYDAIASSGGKSGTRGEPFPFDLHLRDLCQSAINIYQDRPLTISILQGVLKTAIRDINSQLQEEREEW